MELRLEVASIRLITDPATEPAVPFDPKELVATTGMASLHISALSVFVLLCLPPRHSIPEARVRRFVARCMCLCPFAAMCMCVPLPHGV